MIPVVPLVLAWVRANAIRLAIGGLIMGGLVWAYFHIKDIGALAERLRGRELQLEMIGEAHEVDRAVDNLGDGSAADELRRKWSRD